MTEEFNIILNEMKKNPLEEKMNIFIKSLNTIMNLMIKIPEEVDKKIYVLEKEIISLKNKIIKIENEKKEINDITIHNKPIPMPPPSPPSIILEKNKQEIRKAIMGELKELLEKRKENIGEK